MSEQARPRSIPLATMLSESNEAAEPEGSRAVLLFEVGDRLYALDATSVELIVGTRFITPLPYAPAGLLGVASVQGRLRLVVDLAGEERRRGPSWRLVALHGDAQLAVLADHVFGVRTVLPDEVSPAVAEGRVVGQFLHGARAALLLDPERLITV